MSSDKRQVATDALETLGKIIGPNEKRDAIHLAVEPAIAYHVLRPGDHVGFIGDGMGISDNPVGIVDPFLTAPIKPGERFWLIVYPRQITSLRHVWTHPAFDDPVPVVATVDRGEQASVARLQDFANSISASYDELMENAAIYVESEEYWCEGDRFDGEYISDPDEFWRHYEIVTGTKVPNNIRGSFLSCDC